MALTARCRLCLDRPATAAIRCWLNNYPKAWVKAGIDGLRMVEARLTLFFWLYVVYPISPQLCYIVFRRVVTAAQAAQANNGIGHEWRWAG